MKRILFVFFTLLLLLTPLSTSAAEVNEEVKGEIEDELSDFYASLPPYVLEYLPSDAENGDFSLQSGSLLDEKKIFDYILDYLFFGLDSTLKSFASLLILIIISSIFHMMSASFGNESVKFAFEFCSSCILALSVYGLISSIGNYVSTYLGTLCESMNAFVPIMTTVEIMSGKISSAMLLNTSMMIFIAVINTCLVKLMFPLIKLSMMFSCIKSMGGYEFGAISRVTRTTFTSVTVFIMSIFTFIFSLKNILAQGADTLSLKTARFAISSFVPLVGASINEALRTVSSSIGIIKGSCGVLGILIVLLIVLPIIIYLILNKISFGLLSSISKSLLNNKESSIFEEADSLCTYFLTLVACSSVLFIIAITVFLKSSVEVGI